MDNWKYKYGEFEINTPFTRPTHSLFSSWRTQFLSQVDLSNFNVMFMGNAAERIYGISTIATIDIDIILSGEIDSYKNLSNILRTGFKIGLEQNFS
jgi:hypothetical protein